MERFEKSSARYFGFHKDFLQILVYEVLFNSITGMWNTILSKLKLIHMPVME